MSDLISKQAAIELIHSLYPSAPIMRMNRERWKEKYKPYIDAEKALEILPSVERKGKWIKQTDEQCWWNECSECGHQPPKDTFKQEWLSHYCPNCGADMSGEDENM